MVLMTLHEYDGDSYNYLTKQSLIKLSYSCFMPLSDRDQILLHCALASCGAVYCNRSCLWVCGCVCLWV